MEGFFIIVILAGILGLYTLTRSGSNPNVVTKPAKAQTGSQKAKTKVYVPYGYFQVTIFTYDGSSLPALSPDKLIDLRYHAKPKTLRSVYTGTVSDCPNYLTYEGHIIGCIFNESATEQLDRISKKKSVHIYATSLGKDAQYGFPRLITKLPSREDMYRLAQ